MLIKNLFRYWTYQVFSPGTVLREKYESFKALLEYDKTAHEFLATLEDIYYTQKKCDFQVVVKTYEQFAAAVFGMVEELLKMSPSSHWSLKDYFKKFDFYIRFMLAPEAFEFSPPFTIAFDKISSFSEELAGKKAFILSYLNHELELPTPDGFVITTNAFHYFLEANDLKEPINGMLKRLDIFDPSSLEQTSLGIEQLILNASIPRDVEMSIGNALNFPQGKTGNFRVALRSSAVKEDGQASFAGQYKTYLNIDPKDIFKVYKRVIAGKYSASALFYRISRGILDDETPMAVLVLEMIDSKASGVIYTSDFKEEIEESDSPQIVIHSVRGQGGLLVDGKASPDVIRISKKDPFKIVSTKTAAKPEVMVLGKESQTRTIAADQKQVNLISLDEPALLTLAGWGLLLEDHFNKPQDIEWCQDKSGKLFVLQSRPLNRLPFNVQNKTESVPNIINKILCSKGETASFGTASGTLYRLDQLSQLPLIPEGSILVVRHAPPQLVTGIHNMAAILIETGSCASHFSSIAREFKVPAIVNIKEGFHDLVQGRKVTVDADNCIVYDGIVKKISRKKPDEDFFRTSSFMVKLRYVIHFSSQLKLTDPGSDSFVPESCRSLHDIIRFAHETAMKEMFLIGDRKGGRAKGARKLICDIPLLFYVLDVGQGISDPPDENQPVQDLLKPEDIASIPMKAVLKGLLNPGIHWSETSHFDWEEYDKIVMAGGIISADSPRFGSYAVLSKEYLNVNFRFGYHFVILDTICSPLKEDNYILFRFSGGGGSQTGRALRANFIKGILTRIGFIVKVNSDLVDAEFKYGSMKTMENTLDIVGRLLGATKLMDMYLKENTRVELMIDDFMKGRYDFRSVVDDLKK